MAQEKDRYKQEVETILNRLKAAGVQSDEKEKQEIELKFALLVTEWRVHPAEAAKTITVAMLKKHSIETEELKEAGGN